MSPPSQNCIIINTQSIAWRCENKITVCSISRLTYPTVHLFSFWVNVYNAATLHSLDPGMLPSQTLFPHYASHFSDFLISDLRLTLFLSLLHIFNFTAFPFRSTHLCLASFLFTTRTLIFKTSWINWFILCKQVSYSGEAWTQFGMSYAWGFGSGKLWCAKYSKCIINMYGIKGKKKIHLPLLQF